MNLYCVITRARQGLRSSAWFVPLHLLRAAAGAAAAAEVALLQQRWHSPIPHWCRIAAQ
jgi:hypothetical protein